MLRDERMKRRHRRDIWAELLKLSLKPKSKTKLMYQANLSHIQLKKHLKTLIALGLIEETTNPQLSALKTTLEGKQWLRDYKNLLRFFET